MENNLIVIHNSLKLHVYGTYKITSWNTLLPEESAKLRSYMGHLVAWIVRVEWVYKIGVGLNFRVSWCDYKIWCGSKILCESECTITNLIKSFSQCFLWLWTCKELQREGSGLLLYHISVNKRRVWNKTRTINNKVRISATL